MKRILFPITTFVVFVCILMQSPLTAGAVTVPPKQVEVTAQVGEYTLDVSGYIAPFASVVLRDNAGVFLRSTTADKNGNFFFSKVTIKRGFSGFCLTAVDIKQIGSSEACFDIKPATGSIVTKDIFLPPTLGLARAQIAQGSKATAFGYSMPGATVKLRINNTKVISTIADATGYYTFVIEDLPVGEHQLLATARHKGKDSMEPKKGVKVIVMSFSTQVGNWLKDFLSWLWNLLTSLGLGPLWLIFPLLLLILLLLVKLYPEKFTFITRSRWWKALFGRKKHKKKLHHGWYFGY